MQFDNDELLAIYHAINCYMDQRKPPVDEVDIYSAISHKIYEHFRNPIEAERASA